MGTIPANVCERDLNLLDRADGEKVVLAKSSHDAGENGSEILWRIASVDADFSSRGILNY